MLDRIGYPKNNKKGCCYEFGTNTRQLHKGRGTGNCRWTTGNYYRPTGQVEDGTKAVEKIKELEKANLNNSIKLAMTKAGLDEDLFDLVSAETVEDAQAKIDKLAELQKAKDIDNGYKPENKRTEDQYSKLEKDGNVEGMLKNKLGRLFQ